MQIHSKETEKAMVGLMVNYPEEDFSIVSAEDFYLPTYQLIAKAIIALNNLGEKYDAVSIYEYCKNYFGEGVKVQDITEVMNGTYSLSAIKSHIVKLKEYSRKREANRIAQEIVELSNGDPAKLMEYSTKLALASTIGSSNEQSVSYDDVTKAYEQITSRFGKTLYGYSWGKELAFLDEISKGIVKKRVYRIGAPSNTGKAMPYYEGVLTPNGYTNIGSLNIGDKVNNSYGGFSTVTGVFPQGVKPIYRTTFSDGTIVDSCENHLWAVNNNDWSSNDYKVMELKDIMAIGVKNKGGTGNRFSVPLPDKTFFNGIRDLEIDPYVMGIILSEGNLGKSHIQITNTCPDVKARVSSLLPDSDSISEYSSSRITYGIVGQSTLKSIRNYGLSLHRSWEKFIPEDYIFSTPTDRKELLEGLIDGDGCVSKSAYVYTTVSKELAEGVRFIAQSLGGLVTIRPHIKTFSYKGEKKKGRVSYDVRISLPFKLNLSVDYKNDIKERTRGLKKQIVAIDYVGDMDCMCISVDAKDHLYITTGFTLTHNTQLLYNLIPQLLTQINPDGTPVKVAFFTLENTKEDTLVSLMCNHCGLNANLVNSGAIEGNWDYLVGLKDRLFIIDDVYEVDKIFSKCISIKPDVVILDYITHITIQKASGMEKYDQYAEKVPKFAKRQDLAWIDLSNLPKNLQTNDEIRASPGFYGSSILMNNCDFAIHIMRNQEFKKTKETVLHNPKASYDDKQYFYTRNCLDLLITKNRWGSVFVDKTYGINFSNGGKWRELSETDLNSLWAKYG